MRLNLVLLCAFSVTITALLTTVVPAQDTSSNHNVGQIEVSKNLSEWQNVEAGQALNKSYSRCVQLLQEYDEANKRSKIKIGPSYQMVKYEPSLIGLTADLFRSPSETVAQRKFYAYELEDFSSEVWADLRTEVSETGRTPRFSVLVQTGNGFVGTPVKWNAESAETLATMFEESDRGVEKVDSRVRDFAVSIVDYSLEDFAGSAYPEQVVSDFFHQEVDCLSETDLSTVRDNRVYLALSYIPRAMAGQNATRVVTSSGYSGLRLGTEIPSWPKKD